MPNDRKIFQMTINRPALSIQRPSQIYPNLDFWFENKPSGNPGPDSKILRRWKSPIKLIRKMFEIVNNEK
jgi:hypothetical protein